jgi:hypothetical protein
VIARGHLDGRPEVEVATRYELRPCEPGLRVRSELHNGSPDRQAFVIADTAHWGKRRVLPFAPIAGQGYLAPELELLELTDLWRPAPYVAAATPSGDGPAYGVVACDRAEVHGVNDLEVSALGTPLSAVWPGQGLVYERYLVATGAGTGGGGAAGGSGPASAIAELLEARTRLGGGVAPRVITGRVAAEGLAFGGDVRRASIVIRGGDPSAPLTAVVPAADGTFSAAVPAVEDLTWELWSFGRRVLRAAVPDSGDLGELAVEAPALVNLHVARTGAGPDVPIDALVVFDPANDATRADVIGSFHGRQDRCAPWLGPPHGASPACNRVLVPPRRRRRRGPGRPVRRLRQRRARHHGRAGRGPARPRGDHCRRAGGARPGGGAGRLARRRPPRPRRGQLRQRPARSRSRALVPRRRRRRDRRHRSRLRHRLRRHGRRAGRRRSPAGDGRARDDAAHPVPRRPRRGPSSGGRALQLLAADPRRRPSRAAARRGTSASSQGRCSIGSIP